MVWRAAVGDLRRLRQIAGVLTRHGFDEIATRFWRRTSPDADAALDDEPGATPDSSANIPVERRVRLVLQDLGPTFIKLGQILSSRPDLIPRDFITELSFLQDRVEPFSFADVEAVIEPALGRSIGEAFERFDEVPLATASIGQAHRAWLADGSAVVVKVQRPGIEASIRSDLDLLRALAYALEATVEEARVYDPVGIVREFESAIMMELDFGLELQHMAEFHVNFAARNSIVVPQPFPALSSRTVLTMEYIEGIKLSELPEEGHDREAIARTVLDAWYQMVFKDGLFHADPHPGNLLVLPGDRLALLDYGLVGRLSAQLQETLVLLCLAIVMKDAPGLARIVYKTGSPEERISLSAFRDDIELLLDRYLGVELSDIDTGMLLVDLLDVAVRYRIKVAPEYALLAKAGGTIEGVIRDFYPGIDLLEVAQPYARELMGERFSPERVVGQVMRLGMGLSGFLQDVPGQLDQVMTDLEGGRLTIQVENPGLEELGWQINGLASRIMLGLCAAASIVAAAILLQPYRPEIWGLPLLPLMFLFGAGALGAWAASWHFFTARRGKRIRIRDWIAFWRRMRR